MTNTENKTISQIFEENWCGRIFEEMDKKIIVKVNNLPKELESGWMVARLGLHGALWYYGTYDAIKKAIEVADFLENGVVLEIHG